MSLYLFSVTLERQFKIRFVFPYYYADEATVYRLNTKDDEDLPRVLNKRDVRLCMLTGYYLQSEVEKQRYKVFTRATKGEALHALQSGVCDYFVSDSTQQYSLQQHLAVAQQSDQLFRHYKSPYGIAVSYNRTQLHDDIADALNMLMARGASERS